MRFTYGMATKRQTVKQGTGSWYTERGTYTEPSDVPGMVKLMRAGKFIALVSEGKEATHA